MVYFEKYDYIYDRNDVLIDNIKTMQERSQKSKYNCSKRKCKQVSTY